MHCIVYIHVYNVYIHAYIHVYPDVTTHSDITSWLLLQAMPVKLHALEDPVVQSASLLLVSIVILRLSSAAACCDASSPAFIAHQLSCLQLTLSKIVTLGSTWLGVEHVIHNDVQATVAGC